MRERTTFSSTTTSGPFHRSGPYTRFLRRALTVAGGWGVAGVAAQTVEPVMIRIPHVGPSYLTLALLTMTMTVLSGLIAGIAILWDYATRKNGEVRGPELLDTVWESLIVFSLILYVGFGLHSLVTTTPYALKHLDFVSNQHPFQSQAISFAVLTVVVFPELLRLVFVLITSLIMGIIPVVESGSPPTPRFFAGAVLLLCFCMINVAAASWLLRQSTRLDLAQETLSQEKVALRAQQAKNEARQRMNGFIHDHILSVLISVASGLADQRLLNSTARQSLDMLNERTKVQSIHSSSQLFARIAGEARRLNYRIIIREKDSKPTVLTPEIGAALFDATREALSNSLRHAATPENPTPSIVLLLSVTSEGVQVVIDDDGAGFNLETTGSVRFGIQHSILNRLHTVGGNASIVSAQGCGTRVTLTHSLRPIREVLPEVGDTPESMRTEPLMEQWPTRVVILYTIGAHFYQLLAHWTMYTEPWIAAGAFLAFAMLALLLIVPWTDGIFPAFLAYLVPALGGIANFAVLSQLTPHGWPEFESWSIGLLGVLCGGLILYRHMTAAWVGVIMLVLSVIPWVIGHGLSPKLIVTLTIGHIVGLIAWTGVVILARWASVKIISDERQRMELEAERIESEQAAVVVENMLDSLDKQVRPVLEIAVSGEPITPDIRQQAALLEAELRDEIRGGTRLTSLIKDPVRQARERGTAVVLMDDRGDDDLPEAGEHALQECANNILRTTASDRVVIRLAPTGRDTFATINTAEEAVAISDEGSVVWN